MSENVENLVTAENEEEFENLPGFTVITVRIPMLCPYCDEPHYVQVMAGAVPKDGGVAKIIPRVQNRLIKMGWRIPTKADMERYMQQLEAQQTAVEEMENAQAAAKAQGAVYIPRQGREGGDA